jgi:hypothetical protein
MPNRVGIACLLALAVPILATDATGQEPSAGLLVIPSTELTESRERRGELRAPSYEVRITRTPKSLGRDGLLVNGKQGWNDATARSWCHCGRLPRAQSFH